MRAHRARLALFVLAVLPGICVASFGPVMAGSTSGNVNFIPGVKMLDEDDWSPVEDQGAIGVNVAWGKRTWPVQLVVDYIFSAGKEEEDLLGVNVDLKALTAEVGFGIQKTWDLSRTHPYIGGGLNMVIAQAEVEGGGTSVTENDISPGAWVGGGVFWRLGSRFNLGVAGRLSRATVTLAEEDVEAGGLSYGLILGWGWPAAN
ncbi:MAG TPA: hypothetical protein VFG76_02085 [Candidatus Polarisedimenticolia bacterium]|nr:hypothetical protein [Candidatus Polarisedimenticolia bacterium]